MSTPRLPVGVRDFLPRAAARRRAIAEALLGCFEAWGYERIITPAFEYADVLARGLGEGAQAIRFVEPATGEVVALRPDITPQVARLAASRMAHVPGPVRLCYEGAVMRMASAGGPRGARELIQAGVELLGVASPGGDAEIIALAAAALAAVELAGVTIDVGHTRLAADLLARVADERARGELREALARKDAREVARLAAAVGGDGLDADARGTLAALPELYGSPADVLARARALPLGAAHRTLLLELERALDLASAEGFHGRLVLDLGDVRGWQYYTGLRVQAFVDGVGDAVLRGGRYDDLLGRYGRALPAVGFAVDVEAVAQAQKAAGLPPPAGRECVLVVGERAFGIAAGLRTRGVRAIAHVTPGPAGELDSYAAAISARVVRLNVGEDVDAVLARLALGYSVSES